MSSHSRTRFESSDSQGLLKEVPIHNCRRICYAFGGLPKSMLGYVVSVYHTVFLLQVALLPPGYVSIITFGGRVLDALSDPVLGYIFTKVNTRIGQFRPWLICAPPCVFVAYVFLWYVPATLNQWQLVLYYLLMYWLYAITTTCYYVPYASLPLVATNEQHERDTLIAYRTGMEQLGSVLGLALHSVIALAVGAIGTTQCSVTGANPRVHSRAFLDLSQAHKASYLLTAIISSTVLMLCAAVAFFSLQERYQLHNVTKEPFSVIFRYYKSVINFPPFRFILAFFLSLTIALGAVMGNYALYFHYSLHASGVFPFFILLVYFFDASTMIVWQRCVARRFGKKTTYTVASLPLMVILWYHLYLNNNLALIIILGILVGVFMAGALLVCYSVLPDVIASYGLAHGYGKEPLFYSVIGFVDKLGYGAMLGISTLLLSVAGYNQANCENQPSTVDLTLRLLVSVIPVLTCLISLIVLLEYPISEVDRKQLRRNIRSSMAGMNKYGSMAKSASESYASNVPSRPSFATQISLSSDEELDPLVLTKDA